MAKIIIDNQEIECREGIPVLQAAVEAGWDVPHYCYHPGLSVVASCRLCLMEMKMPHPKTREMGWAPKLMPSCQTPIRDGMEVRFASDAVRDNQKQCMEFFLLNHPLDCPVCDQAGECYLQDYSFRHGEPVSRMVEQKHVNPKKDVGPKTLLYSDRCVMCTRCVRFAQEVSGTRELCVVQRGAREEIDVFPGFPLDNPLQGNVVDICPVGALLDKDFLFKKRVWELKPASSICPGCARGCSIRVDSCDDVVYRLKPRHNPRVNDWWICDEGRFGFKYVHDKKRITSPSLRRGSGRETPEWEDIAEIVRFRFEEHVRRHGGETVAALFSPFMACEEAWLLARFLREVAPDSTLAMGPIPLVGEDEVFPTGAEGDAIKFTILKEKCPNRRGIEMVLESAGGTSRSFEEFCEAAANGAILAAWIVGGYPREWVDKPLAKCASKLDLLVVQDMFDSDLTIAAEVVLPACAWVERDGSFVNADGLVQTFDRAIRPPEGAQRDGQYLFEIAGYSGLYSGGRVREMMVEELPAIADPHDAPALAGYAQ
ncbi:MAG: molybdopterin-dependent oxidoreductase [Planctomycetes bacterium]|nr:molybdopterin-dependent oxidoreductase [Planctomycetota bacterium]